MRICYNSRFAEYWDKGVNVALSIETINDFRMIRSVGKLKTYDAFFTFKTELEPLLEQILQSDDPILRIYFIQAYPINSYVLGYLFKLKNTANIQIEFIVNEIRLFMFFEELDLVDEFKIKIMEA